MLTPVRRRTLAPRGQTPVLPCWDRRDRISALSGITLSPRRHLPGLYFQLLPDNTNATAEHVVAGLRELKKSFPRLTVVWDRSKTHSKSLLVRAFLRANPSVVVEDFPAYAPTENPDEGVWGWTKYGRLANLAAEDPAELEDRVVEELVEVKHRPDLLKGFIRQTGLPGLLRAG